MIYIYGGNGSGKSSFAEQEAQRISSTSKNKLNKIYLATMKVYDEEDEKRVEKHRKQRKDKNFITVEKYEDIADIEVDKGSVVLLECMANLVANNKFKEEHLVEDNKKVEKKLWEELQRLDKKCFELIVVGNDIFNDSEETKKSFGRETLDYIELMKALHIKLIKNSAKVFELVFSIPIEGGVNGEYF
jgi:adenosylcobinamide kinase/adenosylcobinamide-phosphate guanylyltransferase